MGATSKALAAAWVIASLVLVVLGIIDIDPQVRLHYSNVLQTLSSLLCGMACLVTMDCFPEGSPLRKTWALVGAGAITWGLGATIFSGYPLLHGGADTPYPYYSDLGYLLTSPLIALGLWAFMRGAGLQAPTWGKAAAMVVLVVSLLWCYYANQEGLHDDDAVMSLTSLGYILSDPLLVAMTVLVASSFRGGTIGNAWWFVLGGSALFFIANQVYTYMVMNETYLTGHWIDLGWILGFGLIAWAAWSIRNMMR